jgi:hypothetical protein
MKQFMTVINTVTNKLKCFSGTRFCTGLEYVFGKLSFSALTTKPHKSFFILSLNHKPFSKNDPCPCFVFFLRGPDI